MQAEQILAFRLARSGLAARDATSFADAAACPASDFARDAALLAVAARVEDITRERYDAAVDAGELVVAHVVRGAIHALAPDDHALFGRALLATGDDELAEQLGEQVQRLAAEHGFAPAGALDEVAGATTDALAGGRALGKIELHAALRERLGPDLLPWCAGCGSHHVAPMLWRYGTVKAGARLDSERRYVLGKPGRAAATDALRRFLSFYGPATSLDFADWAGLAKPHARRLWARVEGELEEVPAGKRKAWARSDDVAALDSPPPATGIRLIPPGDPYLQRPNRALLVGDDGELRKRLFRPVASPGAVLKDGRLVGLWRVKAKGRKAEVSVERLGRVARAALEEEAQRIADLRRASELVLVVS